MQWDGFFPPDVAAELVAKWPTDGYQKQVHDGVSFRRYQDLKLASAIEYIASQGCHLRDMFDVTDDLYPRMHVVEDQPGYKIRPHTDCAGKVISLQVYMGNGPEYSGVKLMPDALSRDFVQIPYRMNYGYAFKVGKATWHKVAESEVLRKSVQVIYYDTPMPNI